MAQIQLVEGVTPNKVTAFVVSILLFLLGFNLSNAQEQVEKVADATEVVSTSAVNEVKPVIAVPASLAKAMVTGKVEGDKTVSRTRALVDRWFFVELIDDEGLDIPSNQRITGFRSMPPPSGSNPANCTTGNSGVSCSVRIPLDELIDTDDLEDMTVEEAEIEYETSASLYAKQPLP